MEKSKFVDFITWLFGGICGKTSHRAGLEFSKGVEVEEME